MSEAKAPVTVSLTIDKSVSKVASWVLGIIIGCSVLMGIGITAAVVMTMAWRDAATEARLNQHQLMSMEALLLREGVMQSGDVQRGSEGNIQHKREERK